MQRWNWFIGVWLICFASLNRSCTELIHEILPGQLQIGYFSASVSKFRTGHRTCHVLYVLCRKKRSQSFLLNKSFETNKQAVFCHVGDNEAYVVGTKKNELCLEDCEDKMSSNAWIWLLLPLFFYSAILLTWAGSVLLLLAVWYSIHFWQCGIVYTFGSVV